MKVEGLEQLRRKFRALPQVARETIQHALIQSGEEFAATARALAPVDNGDLRSSVRVTVEDGRVVVSAGGPGAPHGYVEHGTEHMAARPFFWPAWRSVRKRIRGRVSRAHASAAKKVAAS